MYTTVFADWHPPISNRERKCAENYNNKYNKFTYKNCSQHFFVISNHNSYRVLFDNIGPYILLEKCIYILALEMASPGNQHCANCIGTLSLNYDAWLFYAWRFLCNSRASCVFGSPQLTAFTKYGAVYIL